ncbi:hypothetical protein GALMADRAFT_231236 [Galerina marginata CBS 339.88]|uniref:Uncharacterized protein n=1 Tax=Galerina marginata (strain CBS 339.88) TaxID=685588 RepID=A0A067SP92_GALM3|nr:hypothetical protein GALMADRAFT_231236 [Galerina marginata CBS 339.88]
MATSAATIPVSQQPQLCDYCHQKPKFSNHSYCSKTCAGQAATLCNQCHKKPKFQNFEYCGKNCAALANPGGKARNAGTGATQPVPGTASKAPYSKPANVKNPQQAPAFDPVQLAKLVAQHIPQVQALINPGAGHNPAPAPQPPVSNPFPGPSAQVIPPNNNAYTAPVTNPFLNPAYQVGPAQNPVSNGAVNLVTPSNPLPAAQPLHISTQQAADDFECLIPGCGQPVHVDAKGVKVSEYCSMRHREEAVASGLASPCIMCLTLPQSETDYFCSRGCREESMNKQLEYDDDESE